ncbi:hypothetical protein M2271_003557 [Streptomyces sp. LBL]|uniref:hypothetical protein n=1 Tax=Streptomyces sp. LBL TaxID=2940562 RepID=UPI002476CAB3|nr:hypothetical protein [Streptomyces sp. LBL]MDH6625746.1 hypothetical protein [Streptomyces sp. LBL]
MNPLKRPAVWALAVALLLALALASCDYADSPAQSPGIEIDIDHPKVKKTGTARFKAPAGKAPSRARRR